MDSVIIGGGGGWNQSANYCRQSPYLGVRQSSLLMESLHIGLSVVITITLTVLPSSEQRRGRGMGGGAVTRNGSYVSQLPRGLPHREFGSHV